MLSKLKRKLKLLYSKIRRFVRGEKRPKVLIKRLGKWYSKIHPKKPNGASQNIQPRPIRIATFNVAMFTLAPAIPRTEEEDYERLMATAASNNHTPRGILKSPLSAPGAARLSSPNPRVSINLPENEISLANNKLLYLMEAEKRGSISSFTKNMVPVRSPLLFPPKTASSNWWCSDCHYESDYDYDYSYGYNHNHGLKSNGRSVLEVLREVDADILALQDVKAEEEKGMKPLADLANALGMKFVFAESWAPEFGNAIFSKWPIKSWKIQKIANNDDFRNVLKATIDVPWSEEGVNIYNTQLDHLDENWRMKQIGALSQSRDDSPHILAGGLNSLNASDYSSQRWTDIVKYYEDMGKPTPKVEVMKFLKGKGYTDAKDYAGECEPVVIIAKGQNVQGTCKYGTRVDYILSSSESPYKFVPGSYSVVSSKGTSDHHLVKVDIIQDKIKKQNVVKRHQKSLLKLVRVTSSSCSSRGV